MSYKLNNLLDMHLEGKIDFETFENKINSLQQQIEEKKTEIGALEDIGNTKLDLESRVAFMREKLVQNDTIKEFDRQVFESIVDYVVVGGYNEEGNADPSMITFVYRTGFRDRKNGDHFKPARLNASKKHTGSGSSATKACQGDDTRLEDSSDIYSSLQSLTTDDCNVLQSNTTPDACGGCLLAIEETLILCGLAGFFEEYVPVFLADKNVYRTWQLKRGAKFAEA